MRLTEARNADFVRLTNSKRFGIHAGQVLMVVAEERVYNGRQHGGGGYAHLFWLECEDEHALLVHPRDMHPVPGQEE